MDRRVLLLALSGVRIVDSQLREQGLTLPGFVDRGKTIAELPALGLLVLAAHTPEGWQPTYRDWDTIEEGAADILAEEGWHVVAISALSARILEAYQLADELRRRGMTVVLGGLHVSALPDEAQKHADALIMGQGESSFTQLLKDESRGQLKARYITPREARPLLDAEAPVPRYELLQPERYNRIPLQTMRGCPLDCSFCAASRTISDYQLAHLQLVERSLEKVSAIWPKPFIELADDNTFASRGRGKKLARILKKSGARWFTETDISVADDDELLDTLADSGCAQLLIGLESPRPASLKLLDSRDFKWRRAEEHARAIEKIQSRGISVNGCFVLGLDDDDEKIFEETQARVRALNLAEVQITLLTPFPGTALHRSLAVQKRLLREVYWEQCTLFDVTYQPARMSVDLLKDGFLHLMAALYEEKEVARRRAHFRRLLIQKLR